MFGDLRNPTILSFYVSLILSQIIGPGPDIRSGDGLGILFSIHLLATHWTCSTDFNIGPNSTQIMGWLMQSRWLLKPASVMCRRWSISNLMCGVDYRLLSFIYGLGFVFRLSQIGFVLILPACPIVTIITGASREAYITNSGNCIYSDMITDATSLPTRRCRFHGCLNHLYQFTSPKIQRGLMQDYYFVQHPIMLLIHKPSLWTKNTSHHWSWLEFGPMLKSVEGWSTRHHHYLEDWVAKWSWQACVG